MKNNRNSAWYNNSILPTEMAKGAKAEILGWKTLENTLHFKVLDALIKKSNGESMLDIGCGAAEVGRVYPKLKYAGADLPHIIEGVAREVNPDNTYFTFDAHNSENLDFIRDYDIILMNSFISEILNPLEFLEKVFQNSQKNIIIHRQDFNNEKTFLENYNSYGGLVATNTNINYEDFIALCKKFKFTIEENKNS